jgi:hypothetical protein
MSDTMPVLKDEDKQRLIPSVWRDNFYAIVEAVRQGDFRLERGVTGVLPLSAEDAKRMAGNIKAYGAQLVSLPEETWQSSACQWMGSYWDVWIDLYTAEEGASDLVLNVRVYEREAAYTFRIQSLHVP